MKLSYSIFILLFLSPIFPSEAKPHPLLASIEIVKEDPPVERKKKRKKINRKLSFKKISTGKEKDKTLLNIGILLLLLAGALFALVLLSVFRGLGGSGLWLLWGILFALSVIAALIFIILGIVKIAKESKKHRSTKDIPNPPIRKHINKASKEKIEVLKQEGRAFNLKDNKLEEYVDLSLNLKEKQIKLRKLILEKKKVTFASKKTKQRIKVLDEEIKTIKSRIEELTTISNNN